MNSSHTDKNEVILSICIATYNREKFIGATLESIVGQISESVEIVVADGASTDNTKEVVLDYQKKYPQIKYYQLHKKGGVDCDYCKAIERATGKYFWLMSDDDILKPNAVRKVLKETQHNLGLIIVNSEIRSVDLSCVLKRKILPLSEDRIYRTQEYQDFFADMASYLSFIGCVVIERNLWISREKARYFGTEFVHVGVIFQAVIASNILVIAEPLIGIRYCNNSWTNRFFEIWAFKWPRLIWSFSGYPASIKEKVTPREGCISVKRLIYFRALGAFSLAEYYNFIVPSSKSFYRRALAKLVASLPGEIFNFFAILCFTMVPSRKAEVADLKRCEFYWLKNLKTLLCLKLGRK